MYMYNTLKFYMYPNFWNSGHMQCNPQENLRDLSETSYILSGIFTCTWKNIWPKGNQKKYQN